MLKDELIENFFNSFDIELIFLVGLRSKILQFVTIE